MKTMTLQCWVLRINVFTLLLSMCGAQAEPLRYIKQQQGQEQVMLWDLTPMEDQWLIEAQENDRTFRNFCLATGETVRWELVSDAVSLKAELVEGGIVLEGSREGKPVHAHKDLDGLPWFQPLSYSLARFLESGEHRIEFWMVRPDNYSFVKLQAERLGSEVLRVNQGEIPVERISVRPTGLLAMMWHASYWFAADDGQFLKYESSAAIPGIAETSIQLETLLN